MKYFVLYYSTGDCVKGEIYLKGKSKRHMEERIEHYSNGALSTSKNSLITSNLSSAFLREIDLIEYPHLKKTDFAQINEFRSWSTTDIITK
ncbi:hypothetical protein [Robertmurraya kyonggiensis]|uniref:GIY-YIG domain-containing protein n=1 Tax=Robertmurraya kyonggiensis TaxID=1037680 RepID=A0A4U1CXX5_9BACI|nr:hypothetical protein [Robertmurraya kyonggiensis]TKC14370.1 hypothetical protein FA727_21660 [Robertmurraya kyonggiensis]